MIDLCAWKEGITGECRIFGRFWLGWVEDLFWIWMLGFFSFLLSISLVFHKNAVYGYPLNFAKRSM